MQCLKRLGSSDFFLGVAMAQEADAVEKDVYHAPKHFKKVGKLLLKAASNGEYAYIKRTVGKEIIYDFDRTFWYHLSDITRRLINNLHVAFTRLFAAINSNSATDSIRSIGRLDGAIAAVVDAHQEVSSYEIEEGEYKDLEESGLLLLQEMLASLIQYAVEVEGNLGKQLVDTERVVNENPENLIAGKHTITVNFDSSKSIDKLSVLLEWYKEYKEKTASEGKNQAGVLPIEDESDALVDSVNPVDAAVVGYVIGSMR